MFTLSRPYKESNATNTINKIRNILGTLDLMPKETFHANPYPEIFSVRLELEEDKGSFGTNGKGRNNDYSLASGYAEFLERMQNGLYAVFSRTMISKLKEKYGFYYTPDETYLSKEEFLELPERIISDIIRHTGETKMEFIDSYFSRLNENNLAGAIAVPFYDTKNNKEVFLPLNLLLLTIGSNGMAAGNTKAEAIFQAICELTERWGASEIFYNQMTPPTVPDEFLKQFQDECKVIENIEKSGKYKVTIKDFSANKRIPSVGIIVENVKLHKYRLNVGSDTSFQVALSRCLTEVFQGTEDEEKFENTLLDIPKEVAPYFKNDDKNSLYQRYVVFGKFTKDGKGIFPKSLFDAEPSYPFDPAVFTTQDSYEEEVRSIISNFHKNGYDVYIRDVSFLGFPSVFVYIPEISALGRKTTAISTKNMTFNIIELDKIEPLIFDFENCSDKDLYRIADTLKNFDTNSTLPGLFNIKIKPKSPWSTFNTSFFLAQIWYKLGDIDKCMGNFKRFMEKRKDDNKYYGTVVSCLNLMAEGLSEEIIKEKIKEDGFDAELVDEVINDLSNPSDIFKYTILPKCPNCSECGLNKDCLTKSKMVIADKLYPVMHNNKLNQMDLFYTINLSN